ncbi:MAG: response regulator transcription factor [Lachnospiraceae bacterium]|nr:response regulator transcription factor [Lachnospiraceae bacterium]MBR1852129.1 response regulator transcription factor [Lachnospiraceae bacterium]
MQKNSQIVIVEDDKDLCAGLCKALKEESRSIVSCENLKDAREQIFFTTPALILLDINLPDGSGLDLIKEIREKGLSYPVILLSANDTDADVVKGLELGADDYVTKPFSLSVLRARVNTQLRKKELFSGKDEVSIGDYFFDFERMIFMANGEEISLSKTEQRLLKLLVYNQGVTLSRDHLIDRLWTDGAEYVDENALSVAIKRLRDKLHAKDYIKTVYGLGYMWVKNNE